MPRSRVLLLTLAVVLSACGSSKLSKQTEERRLLTKEATAARNICTRRHLACLIKGEYLNLPWSHQQLYYVCPHEHCQPSVQAIEAQMNKASYWKPPVDEQKVWLESNLQ